MRRGKISYNSYKFYVKKLSLLLITALEQYFVRRLDSLNNDAKQNWKVLNSLMGKNIKITPQISSFLTEFPEAILLKIAMLSVIFSLTTQEIPMDISQSTPPIIWMR